MKKYKRHFSYAIIFLRDFDNYSIEFIFMNNKKKVDIVSNCYKRSYPDGMDVLVYKLKTLIKSKDFIKSKLDLEHTTISIKNNIKKFNCIHLVAPVNLFYPNLKTSLSLLNG